MDNLNNIMQRICLENKNKHIVLYEKPNSYIYESLKFLNIACQYLPQLEELVKLDSDNVLLLLSIDENTISSNDVYRKVGSIILKYPDNFIIINKINKVEYLDNPLHKSLMSLGFKLSPQITHGDIFFLFYTYNIGNYKNSPDWLNSENWANPELWEK
ncbi:MAG: hypothetical protein HOA86_05195 [Gammaproteobacteria bacterium]|jgi:hypothetical protein|nr:hypothetical protein [Gammaproteobacteria bacterium]